jgi:hypothetical protein
VPQAIAYLPPTVFSLTWKAIHPFMDTATRNKVWPHACVAAAVPTADVPSIKTPSTHSAATARVQVTFVNNVKKAREALAGLIDVSNLERCVVVVHTEVSFRPPATSEHLFCSWTAGYRGHVWLVWAGVSVGTATTSSTSRSTAAFGSRAMPSGSRSCSEAQNAGLPYPVKLAN